MARGPLFGLAGGTLLLLAPFWALAAPPDESNGDRPRPRIKTQDYLTAYRVYGGGSGSQGSWYSLTKPTYREGTRNDNALPPENSATHYDVLRIKPETEIQMGPSKPKSWDGDKVARRPGGGNEIWVSPAEIERGCIETVSSRNKLDYGQNLAPRFDLEAQLNRSQPFSEVWYKVQEEGRYWNKSDYSIRAYSPQSSVVTDVKTVTETASLYGKFPGGVLLEATTGFVDGTRLRTLEFDLADASFVINDSCKYDPGLTLEEIAILWKYASSAKDYQHFGAVSQRDFRGAPRDSIVALWLSLADSELGGYAYGYDIQLELYDSSLPNFANSQLRELEAIGRMNGETLRRIYYLQLHALQPRLYLKTHAIEAVCKHGRLSVRKHITNIHFQVFNEASDGSVNFTPLPPGELHPEESKAVHWISRNLAKITKKSPAFQRVLRYSELLGLMRLARNRNVKIGNRETLRVTYDSRRHLSHPFDIYLRADGSHTGPKRRRAIESAVNSLETRYNRLKKDLTPHERVIVVANLLSLAQWLSDQSDDELEKRFVTELDNLVRRFGGGKGISSVQAGEIDAIKQWVATQKGLE